MIFVACKINQINTSLLALQTMTVTFVRLQI